MKEQTKSEAATKNKTIAYYSIYFFVIGIFIGGIALMMYTLPIMYVQHESINHLQERDDSAMWILNSTIRQIEDLHADVDKLRNEEDLRLAENGLGWIAIMRDDELRELVLTEVEINFTAAQKEQLNEIELEIKDVKKELEEEMGYESIISSATDTLKT